MFLEISSTEFNRCTRTPTNSRQANVFDEAARLINSLKAGALGIHFDCLVHIMAPKNASPCM